MTIKQLKLLLSQIPDHLEVELPFPYPEKETLTSHEPFLLHTGDDVILIIPQPMAKIFLEENR